MNFQDKTQFVSRMRRAVQQCLMRRNMGRLAFFLLPAFALTAQNAIDTNMTAKIRAEAVNGSQVSQIFDTLTIDIGPRLTASPAYLRAVDFAEQNSDRGASKTCIGKLGNSAAAGRSTSSRWKWSNPAMRR
jgi:hypothetical protein